jgi:hypothetical protein
MRKAKKSTDKLEVLRMEAARFGLRLRRRGTGYSLHCNAMRLGNDLRRIDFQKLSQLSRWLDQWAKEQLAG